MNFETVKGASRTPYAPVCSQRAVMGWIRTTKDRRRERQYELEGREKGRVKQKDGSDLEDFGEREGMEDG